jgi:hypothetical protein
VNEEELDMKLDAWTLFNLPAEARQMIEAFASPDHESSFVKNIPIGALPQAQKVLKLVRQLSGRPTRVIYRGPRRDYGRSWCVRQDAQRFSAYFR